MIPCFLCPCEDVLAEEVDHALCLGMGTVEEIKRYTGLGTGPCQGKTCLPLLARHLARKGVSAGDLQPFTQRAPAEPIFLGTLAAAGREHERGAPAAAATVPPAKEEA